MGCPPHYTEQHSKHLLCSGRCASCIHAGGLSCLIFASGYSIDTTRLTWLSFLLLTTRLTFLGLRFYFFEHWTNIYIAKPYASIDAHQRNLVRSDSAPLSAPGPPVPIDHFFWFHWETALTSIVQISIEGQFEHREAWVGVWKNQTEWQFWSNDIIYVRLQNCVIAHERSKKSHVHHICRGSKDSPLWVKSI